MPERKWKKNILRLEADCGEVWFWCWHWDYCAVRKISIFREDRLCLLFGRKRSGPVIATLLPDPRPAGYEWCVITHGLVQRCRNHKCCWHVHGVVCHTVEAGSGVYVYPGGTVFPQWYSHCSCERKHLSAVSSKAKILGQFCLKQSGILLHTPLKNIFLSTAYASQDVDALCDVIHTQPSRNASKNWKTTVVCWNTLFHLVQPTSHYEPQGASFLRPPRCQQLEETFTQMPPGLLGKQLLVWHPQPSATEAAVWIC